MGCYHPHSWSCPAPCPLWPTKSFSHLQSKKRVWILKAWWRKQHQDLDAAWTEGKESRRSWRLSLACRSARKVGNNSISLQCLRSWQLGFFFFLHWKKMQAPFKCSSKTRIVWKYPFSVTKIWVLTRICICLSFNDYSFGLGLGRLKFKSDLPGSKQFAIPGWLWLNMIRDLNLKHPTTSCQGSALISKLQSMSISASKAASDPPCLGKMIWLEWSTLFQWHFISPQVSWPGAKCDRAHGKVKST